MAEAKSTYDVWSTLLPALQMLQQRLGKGFKVESVVVVPPETGWERPLLEMFQRESASVLQEARVVVVDKSIAGWCVRVML